MATIRRFRVVKKLKPSSKAMVDASTRSIRYSKKLLSDSRRRVKTRDR